MRADRRPVFDANASAGGSLGPLPDWDLTDLYPAPDGPEYERDLDWVTAEGLAFAEAYEGKLASLDAAGMLACIRRYAVSYTHLTLPTTSRV